MKASNLHMTPLATITNACRQWRAHQTLLSTGLLLSKTAPPRTSNELHNQDHHHSEWNMHQGSSVSTNAIILQSTVQTRQLQESARPTSTSQCTKIRDDQENPIGVRKADTFSLFLVRLFWCTSVSKKICECQYSR